MSKVCGSVKTSGSRFAAGYQSTSVSPARIDLPPSSVSRVAVRARCTAIVDHRRISSPVEPSSVSSAASASRWSRWSRRAVRRTPSRCAWCRCPPRAGSGLCKAPRGSSGACPRRQWRPASRSCRRRGRGLRRRWDHRDGLRCPRSRCAAFRRRRGDCGLHPRAARFRAQPHRDDRGACPPPVRSCGRHGCRVWSLERARAVRRLLGWQGQGVAQRQPQKPAVLLAATILALKRARRCVASWPLCSKSAPAQNT